VRFRKLTVVALAAIAVTGLAGCNTKAGAAAVVDGPRISDSDGAKDVKADAKPDAAPDGTSGTTNPKSYVLQILIQDRLLARAVTAHGGNASDADLTAAKAQFLQGAQVSDVAKFYGKHGYTNSFANVLVNEQALLQILAVRVKASSTGAEILAALNGLKSNVSVSGRYGAWDKKQYSVSSGPNDGVPGFIKLPAPPAVATTAAPTN
jgi:hypothetical protein